MRGRLRPHDPFELIRWLALSQPDPRKALAELVQNSLDANAHRVRVTRLRERGDLCLRIFDDGEGVIPEMDRPEALKYIATHVGHSRKKSLSPRERLALMTQGQYGIGLLGFWSLGQMLEMRTCVPGQRAHRLVLYRDRADFLIEPLRGRLPIDERWTEVVVVGLHREALGALGGRRAADYLASELRGQLLTREVDLLVEDKVSRGRAQKKIPVRPPRFLGERLEGLGPLEAPGYPPIRVEIYLAGDSVNDGTPRGVAVYCSGTLVAESFHDLAFLDLDRTPWTDARLTGLVDFPGFQVAPGSRRGLVPDEAAGAFARALRALEPILTDLLASLDRRRSEELDRTLIRDLQRAFRDFYRHRPRYEMLPVQPRKEEKGVTGGASGADGDGMGGENEQAAPGQTATAEEPSEPARSVTPWRLDLLPPGPLASVTLSPASIRIECGGTRRVRAGAVDATGQLVDEAITFVWSSDASVGEIAEGESPEQAVFTAVDHPAEGAVRVIARSKEREARAEAPVEVLEELPARRPDEGIPEPELVSQPGSSWRSRMHEGIWQVNVGHREYRAIADRPALKLRYLAMLFAKEVVLKSTQDARLEKPLEQLVEVAAYADRHFAGRRGPRRGGFPTA
ncbi:MAG TPA: ATP-binding protein [Candidatus Polarisedimenticolia bacterium]